MTETIDYREDITMEELDLVLKKLPTVGIPTLTLWWSLHGQMILRAMPAVA
jgi:hypothetical protein